MTHHEEFTHHHEDHIQGAVVCTSCDSVYQIANRRLSCGNCNAPLELAEEQGLPKPRRDVSSFGFLKPLADMSNKHLKSVGMLIEAGGPSLKKQVEGEVTCGWCTKHYNQRPDSPNCDACGGVLPLPPSAEIGPQPPSAPRDLPKDFSYRIYVKQNLGGWIGVGMIVLSIALFCFIFPFSILTLLFGWAAAHSNFLTAYRRILALRRGQAVPGKIESVHLYGEPSDKNSVPMFRVYYRFEVDGEPVRAMKYTYDKTILNHFVGEPVWVVYLPSKWACNDIWPPLA